MTPVLAQSGYDAAMPRSIGPERRSFPPPSADDSPEPDSTQDATQEDFLFHLYRGSELLQDNRVLEAKEELEYALTMQPLDPKGQDLLAAVYFRLGHYPRALQIYEALGQQFPRDVAVKVNVALGYLKTGQPEQARSVLKEAVTLNPEHKRAWGYLGLALQKLGELEQAHVAFERGGHPMMARRVNEARRRSMPPPEPSRVEDLEGGLREVFSELDGSDLRFALAESEPPRGSRPSEGPWHTLELGEATRPLASGLLTLPFLSPATAGGPHTTVNRQARTDMGSDVDGLANTRLVPPPMAAESRSPVRIIPIVAQPDVTGGEPASLALPADRPIAMHGSGVLLVRTRTDPPHAFAGRMDAVRVLAGVAATQVLHRRARNVDTGEVLGGLTSPILRFEGNLEVVLGPRAGHRLALVQVEEGLAFVREEYLLGFELSLGYENGRIALDPPGDPGRPGPEGTPVVQLRGSGTAVLELAGALASVQSAAGRPVVARREVVVGWRGRLMVHSLSPGEAPGGQRGLLRFAGEGTVLLCAGGDPWHSSQANR